MSSLDIDGSNTDTVLGQVGGLGSSAMARLAVTLSANAFEYKAISKRWFKENVFIDWNKNKKQ
jgi:hypothetical protein